MARTIAPPPISPSAPLAVADHDLVARIARVWVLEHRPIGNPRELDQLVDDMQAWQQRTAEVLDRRFGPSGHSAPAGIQSIAEAFLAAVGPLVDPNPALPLPERVRLLRGQAARRVAWLSDLRAALPDHLANGAITPMARRGVPGTNGNGGGLASAADECAVVVLTASPTSPTTAAVAASLEALGDGQHVVLPLPADIAGIEDAVPLGSSAVVIVEREPRTNQPALPCVLALGWAAGALGRDRVLAVLAPLVEDHPALDGITIVPAKVRARWRAEVVAWAAAATRPD